MEKMTSKELADAAGVSSRTINRTAKKLFPGFIEKGKKAFFTKSQSFDIMQNVRKVNMIDAKPSQSVEQPQQNVEVIAQAVAIALQSVMLPMMEKMIGSQKLLLPEPVKEDFYSLVGYCKIKGIKIDRSDLALHGGRLKRTAIQKGIDLKKIPDERWGFVNSYPIDLLNDHFAV